MKEADEVNADNVERPVGLNALCEEVERVCREAEAYRHGARLKHLIVPMDPGSGRTTFIEYLTDMFRINGILSFVCSTDDCLELTADASSPMEIRNVFAEIREAADYDNRNSNVIGIDVTDLSNYIGQTQFREFMTGIREVCRTAYVVFFVSACPTKNEETMIGKIIDAVGKDYIKRMTVEPYSREELCGITVKKLKEHGIGIRNDRQFREALSNLAFVAGCSTVADADNIADALIHIADYSGKEPVIDENSVNALIREWHFDAGRSDLR